MASITDDAKLLSKRATDFSIDSLIKSPKEALSRKCHYIKICNLKIILPAKRQQQAMSAHLRRVAPRRPTRRRRMMTAAAAAHRRAAMERRTTPVVTRRVKCRRPRLVWGRRRRPNWWASSVIWRCASCGISSTSLARR